MATKSKQIWIIASSGSEWDDVFVDRVFGTKQQVKKYMAAKIRDAKYEHEGYGKYVENASTTIKSIEERRFLDTVRLYGFLNLSDAHEDYTATPEEDVELVELSH